MNLENLGVQEMNTKELVTVDGGSWQTIGLALLCMGIASSIDHPDEFWAGFTGGDRP